MSTKRIAGTWRPIVAMMRTAVVCLVVGGLNGCGGSPCSTDAEPGLKVTIFDGQMAGQVCDAIVTARDGAYSETLLESTTTTGCVYFRRG